MNVCMHRAAVSSWVFPLVYQSSIFRNLLQSKIILFPLRGLPDSEYRQLELICRKSMIRSMLRKNPEHRPTVSLGLKDLHVLHRVHLLDAERLVTDFFMQSCL
jgi:hypothetical protein